MATPKKTGTERAAAAALPARKAVVIPLPGALLEPVTQNRPRGRRPKNIVPMWRVRMDASPALKVLRIDAQIEQVIAMREACFHRCTESSAHLKACERALKLATERDDALSAEYGRLNAEVKALEAKRAALCRESAA
jgi:hypothetical protein